MTEQTENSIGITSKKIAIALNTDIPKSCAFLCYLENIGAIIKTPYFCNGGQGRGRGSVIYVTAGTAGVVAFGQSFLRFDQNNAKSEAAKSLPLINTHNFTATSSEYLESVGYRKPWASNLTRLLESNGLAEQVGFEIVTLRCPTTGVIFSQKKYQYNIQPFFVSPYGEISLAKTALSRLLRE
jgi:hypothetical protein